MAAEMVTPMRVCRSESTLKQLEALPEGGASSFSASDSDGRTGDRIYRSIVFALLACHQRNVRCLRDRHQGEAIGSPAKSGASSRWRRRSRSDLVYFAFTTFATSSPKQPAVLKIMIRDFCVSVVSFFSVSPKHSCRTRRSRAE